MTQPDLIRIHLNSGASIQTEVELDDETREEFGVESVEELIETVLTDETKPRWVGLGGVVFFTQAVGAIEVL